MKLSLQFKDIVDKALLRSLEQIQKAWNGNPLVVGDFVLREIEVPAASSQFLFPHNLGYTPKDAIITSAIGLDGTAFTGTVTWNWDLSDNKNLALTTSAGCKLRVLLGVIT